MTLSEAIEQARLVERINFEPTYIFRAKGTMDEVMLALQEEVDKEVMGDSN